MRSESQRRLARLIEAVEDGEMQHSRPLLVELDDISKLLSDELESLRHSVREAVDHAHSEVSRAITRLEVATNELDELSKKAG